MTAVLVPHATRFSDGKTARERHITAHLDQFCAEQAAKRQQQQQTSTPAAPVNTK